MVSEIVQIRNFQFSPLSLLSLRLSVVRAASLVPVLRFRGRSVSLGSEDEWGTGSRSKIPVTPYAALCSRSLSLARRPQLRTALRRITRRSFRFRFVLAVPASRLTQT